MAIDTSIRAAVLMAWAGKCFYCGHEASCVDHVVAVKKGGTDEPHNLVASCFDCNRVKSDIWLPLEVLEEALVAAQQLAPFVLEAATIRRKSGMAAMDRLNYGSVPLRDGVKGRALVEPGVRTLYAARDLAAMAAEIASRFEVQTNGGVANWAQTNKQ